MNVSPKKLLGTLLTLVVTAFLLMGLLVVVNLSQQSQDVKRPLAAGERVDLTLSPSRTAITLDATTPANNEFTVAVLATPGNSAKITAVTSVVSHSSNLTLVSVTPGTFFSYPAGTEMLDLGTTCSVASDCRTSAAGVTCTSARCVNSTYPARVTGTVRFDLGAACDVTHLGNLGHT